MLPQLVCDRIRQNIETLATGPHDSNHDAEQSNPPARDPFPERPPKQRRDTAQARRPDCTLK
jgi:hypothetical protein